MICKKKLRLFFFIFNIHKSKKKRAILPCWNRRKRLRKRLRRFSTAFVITREDRCCRWYYGDLSVSMLWKSVRTPSTPLLFVLRHTKSFVFVCCIACVCVCVCVCVLVRCIVAASFAADRCGPEMTLSMSNTTVRVTRSVYNWTAVFGAHPLRYLPSRFDVEIVYAPFEIVYAPFFGYALNNRAPFIGIGVAGRNATCEPIAFGPLHDTYLLIQNGQITTGGVPPTASYAIANLTSGTRVTICTDLVLNTVSFCINGQSYATAFTVKKLDSFYPFVVLDNAETQVRFITRFCVP